MAGAGVVIGDFSTVHLIDASGQKKNYAVSSLKSK